MAILFNEESAPWVVDQLQGNVTLRMSTVNYAEALILVEDRSPHRLQEVRKAIEESSIRLVPPTAEHAEVAAAARLRYPINLGDCFAYALAKEEDCPLLTLDRAFRRTDLTVILPRRGA
ncbi:MAG: type II toxin-antitoxin system VapC family toxin [Acidobacteria bacterium]|nr:type II toxin-antitoxin system VapC family toxin [Acidobacteriota bacterium]